MGKSIRSKRMKKLRSIKREKLMPREQILLEQRAAILSIVKGEEVDESALPVLPEEANAPKRFVHTKSGKAPVVHTLLSRYGHLASNNVSKTKFNSLEALKERYDKNPAGAGVKVKKEAPAAAAASSMDDESAPKLPSTMARRSRGRDRTSRAVTGSAIKVEGEDGMGDDLAASAAASAVVSTAGPSGIGAINVEDVDEDEDQVRYGEFGKPAHKRQDKSRSKHSRNRSKSKSKSGFLNWNKLASSA